VLEGAAEAIQAPHHQGVSFPQVRECLRQARALCRAAAGGVGEDVVVVAAGVLEQGSRINFVYSYERPAGGSEISSFVS